MASWWRGRWRSVASTSSVFLLSPVAHVKGDAKINLEILGRLGIGVMEVDDEQRWELHASEVQRCSLIVDAIVGTGLSAPLAGLLETVVADVNVMGIPIVSVDLPSGLSADTPHLLGQCMSAAMTVTLAAPKLSLVLPPGEDHAGDVVIADIGIPYDVIDGARGPPHRAAHARAGALAGPAALQRLAQRRLRPGHGHRRLARQDRRRAPGGARRAAVGRRAGDDRHAGLVPADLASLAAEYMTEPLAEDAYGQVAEAAVDAVLALRQDVIACGPGLGRGAGVAAFVRALVERSPVPLVLDADAVPRFADDPGRLAGRDERAHRDHAAPGRDGAAARPIDRGSAGQPDRDGRRVCRHPPGARGAQGAPHGDCQPVRAHRINPTGNPGMATGGTGDVLTGMLAAWLAQLLDADAACRLASSCTAPPAISRPPTRAACR